MKREENDTEKSEKAWQGKGMEKGRRCGMTGVGEKFTAKKKGRRGRKGQRKEKEAKARQMEGVKGKWGGIINK